MSTDLRKAAVVLMTLPRDRAAAIFAQLELGQVDALTVEIAKDEPVTTDEHESVVREFVAAVPRATPPSQDRSTVQEPFQNASRGQTGPTLDRRLPSALPAFEFLRTVDSQDLLASLADEHPQTIALVLSHLPSPQCARIVSGLDETVARWVLPRLAAIGPASAEVVADVERGLQRRLARRARR